MPMKIFWQWDNLLWIQKFSFNKNSEAAGQFKVIDWSHTFITFPNLASETANSSWASDAMTFFMSFFKGLLILPSTVAVAAAIAIWKRVWFKLF